MLEALARGAFEREVGRLDKRLISRRNWTVVASTYPVFDVIFNHAIRAALRLKFVCDSWDDLPPSIELLDAHGAHIASHRGPSDPYNYMFERGGGVFNGSPHPSTGRPFICMRGSREFHTHSSHLAEVWDNYRGRSGNDLLGLVDQLWRVWRRAAE